MSVKNTAFLIAALGIVFFMIIQSPTLYASSTISGKVVDEETGIGIGAVAVRINSYSGERTILTNEEGNFVFYEIKPGNLSISYMPPPPFVMPLPGEDVEHFLLNKGKNLYIKKKLERGGIIEGRVFGKSSSVRVNM